MNIRVLGCSGGIGGPRRTTALLLDEDVLIDAGTGVGDLSLEAMHELRHVFITHSHLDHVAGLPLLVDTLFGTRHAPLTVHAQPETLAVIREHVFNWRIWPDFGELPTPEEPSLYFRAMSPGETRAIGGRQLEMIPVKHSVPAVGFSVTTDSGVFAFSGDTSVNDTLWPALNRLARLDLLVIECGFPDRERDLADLSGHYCPEYLAGDLAKLEHDPTVAITHLKPGMEEETFEALTARIPGRQLLQLVGGERFTV